MTNIPSISCGNPFAVGNIRLFIAFRVFFNARFYYPVFTILFLDFGLTLDQFALLNAVWAATNVLVEIPSGALADSLGRKNVLLVSTILMILEMALLCLAPRENPELLFGVFLINRLLSGTAEAAASGADEALAYDTLNLCGRADEWPRVLDRQMRCQSIAFIAAMSVGAAVYDPALMERVFGWAGFPVQLSQADTLRFPIYLTLVMAFLAFGTVLRMREPAAGEAGSCFQTDRCRSAMALAFRRTIQAGHWIIMTPFALVLITAGMVFDHIARFAVTISSQYFRIIELPEASFGLIGSGLALLGMFVPRLSMHLTERRSPRFNFYLLAAIGLAGLWGLGVAAPLIGLAPMILVFVVMMMNTFFLSHYLNRITRSQERATVLSFRGLALNLAYGWIGIAYSLFFAWARRQPGILFPPAGSLSPDDAAFLLSLKWLPAYFAVLLILFLGFSTYSLRRTDIHGKSGSE
ncbi:MAG: MFS transporter [Thermodesulfobacteriota bacterium]